MVVPFVGGLSFDTHSISASAENVNGIFTAGFTHTQPARRV
jgi:hypothetical protein